MCRATERICRATKNVELLNDVTCRTAYSNYPHIRNSIFHLRPKNVFYNMRLSGNEG